MPTVVDAPYKWLRLSSLAMTCAWGIIAGSVGLNALVKSNQEKSSIHHAVPPPTIVIINTSDIFNSGVVLTTVSALIAATSFLFVLHHFLSSFSIRNRKSITTAPSTGPGTASVSDHTPQEIRVHPSARALFVRSLILGFLGVWLLATLIPFTVFFATRSANVRAFLGGIELSPNLIATVEHSLGLTTVYREISYLRLVAVLPWFTMLFTLFSAALLYLSSLDAEFAHHDSQREARAKEVGKAEDKANQPPAGGA
ncbi:hypothetical protein BDN72DRAFT_899796 [Pluteus cervinus]|uniref:Uncharacterized protein n=1 Tax=Pluteus cervinus TaxID=181527 RepID=A0ACD3AM98_9AGAR|nr:hypothetical protein BDN72DRAFT_899796 [Pluteus cervinus]